MSDTLTDIEAAKNVMKMHGAVRQIIYNELGFTSATIKQMVHETINARVHKLVDEKVAAILDSPAISKLVETHLTTKLNAELRNQEAKLFSVGERLSKLFEAELAKHFSGLAADFIKNNIEFKARPKPLPARTIIA